MCLSKQNEKHFKTCINSSNANKNAYDDSVTLYDIDCDLSSSSWLTYDALEMCNNNNDCDYYYYYY